MPLRHLDKLFNPGSIAVIGASARPEKVGHVIMKNLLHGGFKGPIMPVNPRHKAVSGVLTYPDVASLPEQPDLGVICTRAESVPEHLKALGESGAKAAVVLSTGLQGAKMADGRSALDHMVEIGRAHGMRVLGPNCVGLMVPRIGLNASFLHLKAEEGKVAFVSQSGAMCSGVLDWAAAHGVGFSHFISVGDGADLDFGDIIDFLGSDPFTRAILLYIETIHERRNFMSAARAAARNKPIIVVKAGRDGLGAKAAATHTGALMGSDAVFDSAIRRAGMLRVQTVAELFAAAETLGRYRPVKKDRLAILTNGGGLGVVAADALADTSGRLAQLTEETKAKLDRVLPGTWSHADPVDIVDDANGSRYGKALEVLEQASEVDAILVMHAPSAMAAPLDIAESIIETAKKNKKQVLTCWVGEHSVKTARDAFAKAGIPTFTMPHLAVAAFMHMIHYQRNQELLMEVPQAGPSGFTPDRESVRKLFDGILAEGREILTEPESLSVLEAYGIPTVATGVARDVDEAVRLAEEIGYPVALKVLSYDIRYKARAGGVRLHLDNEEALRDAAKTMKRHLATRAPRAEIQGFTVQSMAPRAQFPELIAGVAVDPLFGPVILFGQGGSAVAEVGDQAVALPPLNMHLAAELVGRTRVSAQLEARARDGDVDREAVLVSLTRLSQLVTDFPEIIEADLNPLRLHAVGLLALDGRIRISDKGEAPLDRLAIRPYPEDLEERFDLRDGRPTLLRPIRPEDEPKHYEFLSKLTPEDIRFRFFGLVGELPHDQMARLTQIDYNREMAFIAKSLVKGPDGEDIEDETLGVVRTVTDPNNEHAEYAIVVRSDLKGQKLGWKLLDKMIHYCRARGTKAIVGEVLSENRPMLDLVIALGFVARKIPEEGIMEVKLTL
ncbi:MAG: GNAT family N-acetyltransferase [Magnetovibrionaceae bacterium]